MVAMAIGLPYVTWIQWDYASNGDAAREVPLFFYTVLGLMAVGAWMSTLDRWLGIFVVYMCVRAAMVHSPLALADAHWITLGAGLLLAVRYVEPEWRGAMWWLLIGSSLVQVLFILGQVLGFDPVWARLNGPAWRRIPDAMVHGTFDQHTVAGAFLAIVASAGAWPLTVLLGAAMLATNSALALTATGIAVVVRYWNRPALVGSLVGGAIPLLVWWFYTKSHDSFWSRVNAWGLAFASFDSNWLSFLFGHGPGTWYTMVPAMEIAKNPETTYVVFYRAHNEYLQLLFEGGLVALVIVALWVLDHSEILTDPGVVVIAVLAAGTFPFHSAPIAATCILVLGLAMPARSPECENSSSYWL